LKTSGHFVVSARVCHTASHDARWELRTLTLEVKKAHLELIIDAPEMERIAENTVGTFVGRLLQKSG
jgi:hypothetical protein